MLWLVVAAIVLGFVALLIFGRPVVLTP